MPRDPQPFPITLDGNLLKCRNESRIRDLLSVFSKDEITEMFAEVAEALASKLAVDDGTIERVANKGLADGYCDLGPDGKVPSARLPSSGSSTGVVPIGGIVAWHKSLAGVPALPAEFLECNGQTVSDAGSPLDGQTLPDLNNRNQFLRGAASSGAEGGAAEHVHVVYGFTGNTYGFGDGYTPGLTSVEYGTADTQNHLPPFFEVVWIIRIK